jgi:hypothetical protein
MTDSFPLSFLFFIIHAHNPVPWILILCSQLSTSSADAAKQALAARSPCAAQLLSAAEECCVCRTGLLSSFAKQIVCTEVVVCTFHIEICEPP